MISQYFSQISDDDLFPEESRQIYLRESELQGEKLEMAIFRLRQLLDGLREQRAIAMHKKATSQLPTAKACGLVPGSTL